MKIEESKGKPRERERERRAGKPAVTKSLAARSVDTQLTTLLISVAWASIGRVRAMWVCSGCLRVSLESI